LVSIFVYKLMVRCSYEINSLLGGINRRRKRGKFSIVHLKKNSLAGN
jgi:hypothetical protein